MTQQIVCPPWPTERTRCTSTSCVDRRTCQRRAAGPAADAPAGHDFSRRGPDGQEQVPLCWAYLGVADADPAAAHSAAPRHPRSGIGRLCSAGATILAAVALAACATDGRDARRRDLIIHASCPAPLALGEMGDRWWRPIYAACRDAALASRSGPAARPSAHPGGTP